MFKVFQCTPTKHTAYPRWYITTCWETLRYKSTGTGALSWSVLKTYAVIALRTFNWT
jgi:hypothetical protein